MVYTSNYRLRWISSVDFEGQRCRTVELSELTPRFT